MAYIKDSYDSLESVLESITSYVTSTSIHGDEAWVRMPGNPQYGDAFPYGRFFQVNINENDKFYIGMMINEFKPNTYRKWLFTHPRIKRYVLPLMKKYETPFTFNAASGLINTYYVEQAEHIDHEIYPDYPIYKTKNQDGYVYRVTGAEGTTGIVDIADTSSGFSPYGKYLSFGVFKQFDKNLRFVEQGGHIDQERFKIPLIPLVLRSNSNTTGYGYSKFTPPPLDGIGYPMLFLNDSIGIPDYPEPQLWIIKDNLNLTVVMKTGKFWQTINIGMMESVISESFPFPAYMCGPTGLVPTAANLQGAYRVDGNTGVGVSLNPNNPAFSNSVPAFPCRVGTDLNCPTQINIMQPDGQWRYFCNYQQDLASLRHEGVDRRLAYPYTTPARVMGNAQDDLMNVYPTYEDFTEFAEYKTYVENGIDNFTHHLIPLYPVQNMKRSKSKTITTNIYGNNGTIPRYYYANCEPTRFGEISNAHGKFLIIPNVWEDRLFYYKYHFDAYNNSLVDDFWRPSSIVNEYDQLRSISKRYRMAIKLD